MSLEDYEKRATQAEKQIALLEKKFASLKVKPKIPFSLLSLVQTLACYLRLHDRLLTMAKLLWVVLVVWQPSFLLFSNSRR